MDRQISCSIILNTFAPDFEADAERIIRFARDNGLAAGQYARKGGRLILCSRNGAETVHEELTGRLAGVIGCSEVIRIVSEHCMPGEAARATCGLLSEQDVIILPGNKFGEEMAVHLETSLGGSSITGALSADITFAGDAAAADTCCVSMVTVRKRIYAGHVTGTYELKRGPFILSIGKSLPAAECSRDSGVDNNDTSADITAVSLPQIRNVTADTDDGIEDFAVRPAPADSDLDAADCIAVIGMGAGNKSNAHELRSIAEACGFAAAGSRPCVMNAWLPMSRMLGVSGRAVAPGIAILLGVSGAQAFYEGVKGSGRIISVNSDSAAPAARKSDLAVTGDCMEIMRALGERLGHGNE